MTLDPSSSTPRAINTFHCPNVGHFYTEELPNILYYNVTKICGDCSQSIKTLVTSLKPDVEFFPGSHNCDESNSPIYSCFMTWTCHMLNVNPPQHRNKREYLLLSMSEYWKAYNKIFSICDVENQAKWDIDIDVMLFNREDNRVIKNYELLERALVRENFSYVHWDKNIHHMSQCEIFQKYAGTRVTVVPYGADQLYPLLLKKPVFTIINRQTEEGFWETMRYQLAIKDFAAYKIVASDFHILPGEIPEFGSNFNEWSHKFYYHSNLVLTEENVEDIITFIKHTLPNK